MTRRPPMVSRVPWLVAACLCAALATVTAQTKITAPKNKYPVSEDVKLGREEIGRAHV